MPNQPATPTHSIRFPENVWAVVVAAGEARNRAIAPRGEVRHGHVATLRVGFDEA